MFSCNNIVLGDLGLARDAEMMSKNSLAKGVGTVTYMAPELWVIREWHTKKVLLPHKKKEAFF